VLDEKLWAEKSFRHRNTKLLCPTGHGLKKALTVNESGQAVLDCGCTRPQVLPVPDGRIGVEQLGSRVPNTIKKLAHDFFPSSVSDFYTTQRVWIAA
jgi:hypothetical protein